MSMKRRLKDAALSVSATIVGGTTGSRDGVIVVPPAPRGSIGDDAMIWAVFGRAVASGVERVSLMSPNPDDEWDPYPGPAREFTFSPRTPVGMLTTQARAFASHSDCYIVGADTLDGCYNLGNSLRLISTANFAVRAGVKATILGSSMRAEPHPEVIKALRNIEQGVRVCFRDPVSHERAERLCGREFELTADAAFMLEPAVSDPATGECVAWIEAAREAGGRVVAINYNPQVLRPYNQDTPEKQALLHSYTKAISEVLSQDPSRRVVLIPHDYRGPYNDEHYAQALHESLPEDLRSRAYHFTAHVRATDTKAIAHACDAVLSGRMHFVIAALGSGVPAAAVTYQGKFEGLYQHFDLDPLYLDPDAASDPGQLQGLLERLFTETDALRDAVRARLPHVKSLSNANLAPEHRSTPS